MRPIATLLEIDSKTMSRASVIDSDGDARDFYTKRMRPEMIYAQKRNIIESHYNSQGIRLQILTYLESLDFPACKK